MVTEEQLQEIVRRIVEGYAPDRIILFGSYAYGTPTEDSDVDLLVLKADAGGWFGAEQQVRQLLPDGAPADIQLLVRSRDDVTREATNRFSLVRTALATGREMYRTDWPLPPIAPSTGPLNAYERFWLPNKLAELNAILSRCTNDLTAATDSDEHQFQRCALGLRAYAKLLLLILNADGWPKRGLVGLLEQINQLRPDLPPVTSATARALELYTDSFYYHHEYRAPTRDDVLTATQQLHAQLRPAIEAALR